MKYVILLLYMFYLFVMLYFFFNLKNFVYFLKKLFRNKKNNEIKKDYFFYLKFKVTIFI